MPTYKVSDPTGRTLEVSGATPPNPMQIKALFDRYDAEQDEDPLADERTFGGQLFETAKGIPRGFLGSFLTAGEGLAELADAATNTIGLEDLIDSGEDNAMVSFARDGRAALQESLGADEAYRDTWMTKFGDGLGSFASFLTPGLLAKGLGATGKLLPTAGAVSLAVGSGSGDQAQRIQRARDQGIEVSQEDEDLAIGVFGAGIGLSELAAPTRLLSRLSKNIDPATKIGIKEKLVGALGTGAVEGVQEALATVFQDATERGIYNENLAKSDSLLDDFTVGGAVGAFADLALGGAKGRRRQMGIEAQNENQKNAKEILERERQNLSQEVSSAQAAYEAELAANQEITPITASEVDLGEIEAPRRGEFVGAAGSSGAYLNVVDREGNEFQAEEKTAIRKGKEERYVRRLNDNGTFTNIVLSRDGVPVQGVSSEVILPPPENIPSRRSKDPMLAYARRIRELAGDSFLSAGQFSVKEQTVSDGTQVDGRDVVTSSSFQVEDINGKRYGKPFAANQREEATSLAGNLNEQLSDAGIAQRINTAIDSFNKDRTARFNAAFINAEKGGKENFAFEGKEYSTEENNYNLDLSPDERSTMFAYGWKTLNIDQNTYTSAEVNQAGETTVIEGFDEQMSNEDINNTVPSKLTMSQRINKKRMAKGKTPTNAFTIEEVKGVLKNKLGNLRTGEIETETYKSTTQKDKDGKSARDKNGNTIPIVVSSSGEVITGHVTGLKKGSKGEFKVKPFVNQFDAALFAKKRNEDRNITNVNESVFANKTIRISELNRLLESKNIITKVGSPEFKVLKQAFIGVSKNKQIDDLSNAEMKILYQKIRSLPQFADPIPLVNFLPKKTPVVEAVQEEVVQEEVIPDDQPQLLLPQKTLGQERLEVIQKALDERMNKTGLGDIKATISRTLQRVLRNAEGELVFGVRPRGAGEVGGESFGGSASLILDDAPPSDVQAFYSTPTGEIFLGLDRIDSTLPIEQQVDAALELLDHEQVHAMREANLFTDKEWEILSKAAENTKSDQFPDKTFLRVARDSYGRDGDPNSLSDEGILEEAVAELVRAARKNPKIISGKPKNLIGRIVELFARLKGFITGSGYTNFESLIADIEGGAIGARERGARISQEAAAIVSGTSEGQRTPDFIPEVSEEVGDAVAPVLGDKFSKENLPIKTRVPAPEELSPILPIGEVEQELLDLFKISESPTSSQLAKVAGSPNPRTNKTKNGRKVKNKLDSNVKPTPFTTLRMMARVGLEGNSNRWYDQFGVGIREIVGEKNLPEASVVFGITSQQNSAEQNLADTLHIMAVARKIDPVKDKDKFIKELRNGKRPGGQGLKITGDQINRITRLYNEGFAEAGLKTSTYMQMIQDRASNKFNPFSVQDVHMARVFGFNRKKIDPKSNKIVDDAKIPTDNSYRYAQFLTSKLAEEFGVTPNQMQAALWFYAKSNLTPLKEKGREGKPGTWESAKKDSQREIKQIQDMVNSGVFDKNNAATLALANPVKASNKITTKSVSFSNILQNEDLLSVARARSPKAVFSANPGNARGYGFPKEVELSEIIDFNREAIDVITDESGQIPFLRDLGISHEVTETFGSYEGIEPSITVSLLDGTPRQASFAANILGDALLQDAAIMARPSFGSGSQVGVALQKKDGSNFEIEELKVIGESVNPEKSPYGLNFTLVSPNVLSFMDGRVYDDSVVYNEAEMLPEFIEDLRNKLPASLDVDMGAFYQEGDYFESSDYKKNIRIIGSEGSVPGSSDIYGRIDDTLYKPFWELYTKTAKRIGFEPDTKERPDPRLDEKGQSLKIESVGKMSVLRKRADGSLVGGDSDIQKVTRDAGAVQKVVDKNEKDAVETPADYVPKFSFTADPEAQYVAQNPEEGITPGPTLTDKFSRRNTPELAPTAQATVSRIAGSPQTDATPGETYLESVQSFTGGLSNYLIKIKQETIQNYAKLEILNRDPAFKQNLADTSSIAAALMADRSMGIVASALKSGVAVYQDGMTKVVDFIHINKSGVRKKYKGLVDVMAPLYSNEYNVSLEELAQAYAIAKRADRLRRQGLPVPTEAGDLAVLEAEIAKFKNEDGIPIIEEWYDTWQAYNSKTVDFMKATGIVDNALAKKWIEMSDYIPFYRQGEVAEGENVNLGKDVPQMFKRNMTTAVKLTKLKGSEKAVNVPMLDAITRNLTMAIDSGMKNVAQQRIVRDMIQLGLAEKATPQQRKNKTQHYVVSFKVKGVEQHYSIKDPLVYESMQPIAAPSMATAFVGGPSKLLREMITRDPGFMFANMMRDTLSAYVTSGSNFIPVIDTIKNINLDFEKLERFGVVGGYDFSNDPDDVVRAFGDYSRERGVDVDGQGDSVGIFKKLWNWSGNATTASDAATRKAVYYDVLARTGNEAEAAFQALEVINFSRRGRNAGVRLLTTAIPFLNARFQGLDVLYRGFMGYNSANRENSRKQAVTTALMRGSILMSTTVAYWLMFSDEEEYKQATDEQRDLNWILSLPKSFGVDVPLRIPVPFEVGLLFKTIPERILDTYGVAEVFGKTGQTSQRELGESLKRGIGETLAVNPLGAQIVAPLIEAVWNKNFFTGRDIVPFYLSQNRSQGLISRASNTEVSKLLGEATNISPMKIDHVMYGYVGTLGGYLIDAIDEMVFKNPAVLGDKGTAAPTKDFTQLPVMKRFFLNKFSSGDVQDFYDLRKEVQTLSGDLKLMAEEGRMDEYEAVFRARGHLLAMKDSINYTAQRLTKLRKQRQIVERSDLSSDLKRDMIDEIQKEIELAVRITPMLKRQANLPVMKKIGI